MNPIEAVIILFVVIGFIIGVILLFSSAFGLFLIQHTHGITEEQRQANREKYARLIEEDIRKQDNGTIGCIDHNFCGTPSPEFADSQTLEPTTPAPDPFDRPNRITCLIDGGYYYEDNGEPHCIVH
jgi:hypothetical protein